MHEKNQCLKWLAFWSITPFALANVGLASSSSSMPEGNHRKISTSELLAPKKGYVVDVATGKGISDVFVIADWLTDSSGIAGSARGGQWCNLQRITKTGPDGEFEFPGVGSDLDTSDAGTRIGVTPYGVASQTHEMTYRIYAIKPGFVRTGDDVKIKYATSGYLFDWQDVQNARFSGKDVQIETITMEKTELDPEATWVYEARLLLAADCSDRTASVRNDPEWSSLTSTLASAGRPLACKEEKDVPIKEPSWKLLLRLLQDSKIVPILNKALDEDLKFYQGAIRASQLCAAVSETTS